MSSGQRLPAKKEVVLALLEESDVFIHLDPRSDAVRVPPWFKKQPHLVLQIGLNMPVPIRDLEVDEQAVSCTLSFNRSPFFCHIPWPAVYALVGSDGRAMVWPDDIPPEVAAQAAKAAQVAEQRPQKRAHLRAVEDSPEAESADDDAALDTGDAPSEDAPVEEPLGSGVSAGGADPLEEGEPAGAASSDTDSVERPSSPPNKGKRSLPPYLRIVK